MPHARIDMHRDLQPQMADISDAMLRGMVAGYEMPADDLFQIFRLHDQGELVYSPTFPNQQRTDIIFIELTAGVGVPRGGRFALVHAIALNTYNPTLGWLNFLNRRRGKVAAIGQQGVARRSAFGG